MGHVQGSEQPQHGERSCECPHALVLIQQGRHVGPMVIDVGHSMPGQYILVERTEQTCITDLHGITKVIRELAEKFIEPAGKFIGGHPMALKLEQEWSGMWFELRLPIGCENKIVKECCVEKTWIGLPGPDAIAWLVCVERNRNFLPDLATHFDC